MFIAALLINPPNWKKPKSLSSERLAKAIAILSYNDHCLAINRNKLSIHIP